MVQAALYQLVLDRRCGEYELPDGAALIACGNRETDRGVVHRMPTPLASRFVHLDIRVDAPDWRAWGAENGIAPENLFFVQMHPELLNQFNPQSVEKAFPCPRTWEFVSNIVHRRNGLDPTAERALFREVRDRIVRVDPDVLRPSRRYDARARERVKQDADELAARFAGYFAPAADAPDREAA